MTYKGYISGKDGEEIACQFLRSHGYEIVERNWRTRFAEIDIIARDGDAIVFVEVKSRASREYGGPEAALSAAKRSRLVAAAAAYLSAVGSDLSPRFDFVALTAGQVKLYRNAFQEDTQCSHGC